MTQVAHDDVIPQLAEHLAPFFASSPDGVYVWLDEQRWTCNERFAQRFGYRVDELENTPHLLQRIVHEDDQELFSWSYWNRVQAPAFPTTLRFRAKRNDGSSFNAETEMIR